MTTIAFVLMIIVAFMIGVGVGAWAQRRADAEMNR